MEIIIGLLILGLVLFSIYRKVNKTTPIVEEIKEEFKKAEEAVTIIEAKVEEIKTEVAVVAKKASTRVKKTAVKAAAIEKAVAAKVAKPKAKKTKV
jgi:preprotein translocase subunit YajC